MSFNNDNLKQMTANFEGSRLYNYVTADAIADINDAGYFDGEAVDRLRVNDVIMCVSSTGGTPAVHFLHVNANDGTTVDVTDGLAVGTTDSD